MIRNTPVIKSPFKRMTLFTIYMYMLIKPRGIGTILRIAIVLQLKTGAVTR